MQSPIWLPVAADSDKAAKLTQQLELHPVVGQLLVQRGITEAEEVEPFFKPHWDQLYDPFLMKDMDRAVDRLDLAIRRDEKIMIYGDYDVDGTMSVSFLYQFLLDVGHRSLEFYIPDRYKEGYGLSEEGVAHAAEQGVSLLITVDCGIRAQEQVDSARGKGMDVTSRVKVSIPVSFSSDSLARRLLKSCNWSKCFSNPSSANLQRK